MRQHENIFEGVDLLSDDRSRDHGLARSGRGHKHDPAPARFAFAIEIGNRFDLIWAKFSHAALAASAETSGRY
jgi:hypothetical protein